MQPLALIDGLGRATLQAAHQLAALLRFAHEALRPARLKDTWTDPARRGAVATQLIFSGIDALPLTVLLALAAGFALGSELIALIDPLTDDRQTLDILVSFIGLEIAPLLTAFLLIARSGTAMAVELANMSHNRQLEGLQLLGVDPIAVLATPRLLALALAQLGLSILFATLALGSGIVFAALGESISLFRLLPMLPAAVPVEALVLFVLRNLLYGLVIAAAACHQGMSCGRLGTEVPQHAQRAVVGALLTIFVLDGLFAMGSLA
ncbi:MAG: ABC transporter permease [Gammaproteobacteria bacterium]|nr:MAG: ABC transporter permease [Gammaproteobacteria bacterium]